MTINKMGTSLKDPSLTAPIIETKSKIKNKSNIIKLVKRGEKKRKITNEKLNNVKVEGRVWINFIILGSLLPRLILATPEL